MCHPTRCITTYFDLFIDIINFIWQTSEQVSTLLLETMILVLLGSRVATNAWCAKYIAVFLTFPTSS